MLSVPGQALPSWGGGKPRGRQHRCYVAMVTPNSGTGQVTKEPQRGNWAALLDY